MKVIDVKQNTYAWYRERLGRPTASDFDKIITASGKASESQVRYMYQLIYERIYGVRANYVKPSQWMARGKELEPAAREEFQRLTGWKVNEIGFVTTDDGKMGCSPDGTIWGNPFEGVEIKIPEPWRHIMYTVEGPLKEYKAQIHAQLYIAGFEKVHFFSYNPGMPCKVWTIYPDKGYIENLDFLARKFVEELDQKEAQTRALGDYIYVEATQDDL